MKDNISIVGAGLVGSLLGLSLKQRGFDVQVFEKRKDPRKTQIIEGRSINLALSQRGIKPLQAAGVFDKISPYLIPMHGRMMHDVDGNLTYQPYGLEGQFINSVPRWQLNELLIESSEEMGVEVHFEHKLEEINFSNSTLHFAHKDVKSDVIIGTDGAFSTVRKHMQATKGFSFSQHTIEHSYKELTIEPTRDDFALEPDYLHIWPRGNFMLIALPNYDKTFTCTLFFPTQGPLSFESLRSEQEVTDFFEEYFADVIPLIPDLASQFASNPTSGLTTIKCDPWNLEETILLGDAAHAIVPFYGQGMNSGFEDVSLFLRMAEEMKYQWGEILPAYAAFRKKDADAISELALNNFIEMRDHVADQEFLLRKKVEAKIQSEYPADWIPLYSMVTFSDMPYSEALRLGKIQEGLLKKVLEEGQEDIDFEAVVSSFKNLAKAD